MRRPPTGTNPISSVVLAAGILLGSAIASAQIPPPPPVPATAEDSAKAAPKAKDAPPAPPKAAAKPGGTRARKPGDDEPIVMSAEAMAKARGKSTERDRYGAEPDWNEIPAWRQTSFFGIKAEGKLFVYVVDCSGSMDDEDRLDRAKTELRRSINGLQSPQRFKVIFYNDHPLPMPGDLPRPAEASTKLQLARWMSLIEPGGPTDPRTSMALALALKPDAVFLLSDGAFPEGTPDAIAKLNPQKVPIHCVDLANGAAGEDLRKIAAESGGQYAARGR